MHGAWCMVRTLWTTLAPVVPAVAVEIQWQILGLITSTPIAASSPPTFEGADKSASRPTHPHRSEEEEASYRMALDATRTRRVMRATTLAAIFVSLRIFLSPAPGGYTNTRHRASSSAQLAARRRQHAALEVLIVVRHRGRARCARRVTREAA